ncbi:MAG: hypothetical protein U0350_48145 [Caldilineaceae bacterium]
MFYIVDSEVEDYWYTAHWFEEAPESELLVDASPALTIHLNSAVKVAIRELAAPRSRAVSTLLPELIDEWLDLPIIA